jgi:hypothetical protein
VYLDPVVLRDVLLGAVGFVESVAEQRARQMRPADLQGSDASVQVCGCALVKRACGMGACVVWLGPAVPRVVLLGAVICVGSAAEQRAGQMRPT